MNIIAQLEAQQLKADAPDLRPGETVRVHVKVVEGEKERTQVFEGVVIGMAGTGSRANFTVRKDLLRRRRRAHFPDPFSAHRKSRSDVPRQSPPRQTLLFAGAVRQGRSPHRARSLTPTLARRLAAKNVSRPFEHRIGVKLEFSDPSFTLEVTAF